MGIGDIYAEKDEREMRNDRRDRGIRIKDAIKELNKHPDDTEMWKSFDAALEEVSAPPSRPPGSFTIMELATRKGIGRGAAARQVRKLVEAGKCKKLGAGNAFYYVMAK